MTARKPRSGMRWRVLVHEYAGRGWYGIAHDIRSDAIPHHRAETSGWERRHVIPNTDFDELVVGSWLHVEEMGAGEWWMNVAGVVINVTVDREGRPKAVLVEVEPEDGVLYEGEVQR